MKKYLIILMILFILMGAFNMGILGRSIKDIQARMVGQTNYRINVVKGVVESENINKTYNCYIAGETVIYPNIPTFSRDPKLQPGDEVTIEFINGCRETPAILAPEDIRERPVVCIRCYGEIDTAIYDSVSFSVDSEDMWARGMYISPDGKNMYIMGRRQEKVFQYSLSIPWLVDSAAYGGKFFDVSSEERSLYGLSFKPDGTEMYIIGWDHNTVFQYSLATAWEVNTAAYGGKNKDVDAEVSGPKGLDFGAGGSKMYISCVGNNKVFQYSLSTYWDIDTAVYDVKFLDVSGELNAPNEISLNFDGSRILVLGYYTDTIYQYNLSDLWEVDTAIYSNKFFDATGESAWTRAFFICPTGCKMYIVTASPSVIYQYSIGR